MFQTIPNHQSNNQIVMPCGILEPCPLRKSGLGPLPLPLELGFRHLSRHRGGRHVLGRCLQVLAEGGEGLLQPGEMWMLDDFG